MARKLTLHKKVTFVDEVAGKDLATQLEDLLPTRKQLVGRDLQRRRRAVWQRALAYQMRDDEWDFYDDGGFGASVFEDVLMELSEVDMEPICYDDCFVGPLVTILDRVIDEGDTASVGLSSDSGVCDLSLEEDSFVDFPDTRWRDVFRTCSRGSERVDVAILAGLLQTDSTSHELFSLAYMCAPDAPSLNSVDTFARSSSDLDTLLSVANAWLTEEKNTNIYKWCRKYDIHSVALQRAVQFTKEVQYLTKSIDNQTTTREPEHLTKVIADNFKEDICIYLGHPDVGYYKVSSKEVLPICPASALRLTSDKPKFAICFRRHVHHGNDDMACHYFETLSDELGMEILKDAFPDFLLDNISEDMVSVVPGVFTVGCEVRDSLFHSWHFQDPSLRDELAQLCQGKQVGIDLRSASNIKLFTPEKLHSTAATFLNDKINEKQTLKGKEEKHVPFPKAYSSFKLIVGQGPMCKDVAFSDQPLMQHLTSMKMSAEDVAVAYITDVAVSLELDPSKLPAKYKYKMKNPLELFEVKIRQILNADMYSASWNIIKVAPSSTDHMINMTIVFSDYLSSRHGVSLLSQYNYIRILNDVDIAKQGRSLRIVVHRHVMTLLGQQLMEKLKKLEKSGWHQLKIEHVSCSQSGYTFVNIAIEHGLWIKDIIDKLTFLKPKKYKLDKQESEKAQLLFGRGVEIMRLITRITNVFLHLPKYNSTEIHIYTSSSKSQEAADAMLTNFLHPNFERPRLEQLGEVSLKDQQLPKDFYVRFHQATAEPDMETSSDGVRFCVDKEMSQLWLLVTEVAVCRDTIIDEMKLFMSIVLKTEFNMDVTADDINFTPVETKPVECVTCFSYCDNMAYTLQSCGHSYCVECLKTQVETGLAESHLPLECGESCCGKPFSLADLTHLVHSLHFCTHKRIMKSALAQLMSQNSNSLRYCAKPGCEGVFRRTPLAEGGLVCPLCHTHACHLCFERDHPGVSCELHAEIGKWMDESPRTRKKCSNCSMGIERFDGCNNVHCVYCKKNICWFCLEYFHNSKDCYEHMDKRKHWRRV